MLSPLSPAQGSLRLLGVALVVLLLTLAAQAAVPNAPTNLTAFLSKQPTSYTYAFLWTDNSTDETAFVISYRFGTSGAFTAFLTVNSPATPNGTGATGVVPSGYGTLATGTVIQFQVASQNGSDTSSATGPATITIPADSFNPPSAVTATATSETVIHVSWTDDATTEDGEELEVSTDGGANYSKIADILFYQQKSISISGFAPGTSSYRFRLKAYKEGTPRTYTADSSPAASATTPFIAPTALTAVPEPSGNGNINLTWADNSTAEGGYLIYLKKNGAATYTLYDSTLSNITAYAVTGLAPGTAYEFKVTAAFQAATLIESAPSNTATATTTSTLLAPTALAATALAPNTESSIKLTWTDNTTLNVGYEIEGKLTSSAGGFVHLGDAADGTVFNMPGFEPGTSYDFQIRAFYQEASNPRVYSDSSTLTTHVTPFNAPSAPTATVFSDSQIDLTWTDNSLAEEFFAIYFRLSGTTEYFFYGVAPKNATASSATSFSASGLIPGKAYDFKISSGFYSDARDLIIESAYTSTVSATTKDGFTSSPLVAFLPDGTYAYTATTSSTTSSRTTWSATNLPAGLNFDTTTGAITGTPTAFGVFTNGLLSATFSDGRTTTLPLTFRIVRPPATPLVGTTIAAQTLTLGGGDTSVLLTDKFSDPDSESAVRVVTNLGTMDFILYNGATPNTVTNFMNYVTSPTKHYNGSVFHRADPGFVIQGGAFKVASAPNNFSVTDTNPSPPNEPGISNVRGTVAMAKSNTPNSATNQFFVNLADSSLNLDFQNGGFTVFARVAGGDMTVADAIDALPKGNYSVNLGVTPVNFEDWPIDAATAPPTMDTTKVVTMTSVAPVPVLSYSIFSNSNPTAVQATLDGTNLVTHALSGGQSTITLRATDLDGNTIDQTFTVTVNESANAWAASQGLSGNDALPDADPDFDGLSNFHEFAFMSHPNSSASSARPFFVTTSGAVKHGEITFPVRKFTTGLIYIVEASETLLPGSWTTLLWTSTDGFAAANVVTTVDQSDRTIVTIRDIADSPPAMRRFLRVRVTSP